MSTISCLKTMCSGRRSWLESNQSRPKSSHLRGVYLLNLKYKSWPTHPISFPLRMGDHIQIQLNHMKDVYAKLEKIQSDCAVTRTARLIHIDLIFMGCSAKLKSISIGIYTSFQSCLGGLRRSRKFCVFALLAQRLMLPWTTWWCGRGYPHCFFFDIKDSRMYSSLPSTKTSLIPLPGRSRLQQHRSRSLRSLQLLQSLPQSPKGRRVRSRCFWVMSA